MLSMTGFGHVDQPFENFDLTIEIKTVNSRYFDFKARLNREISVLESVLKKEIQTRINRGRVEVLMEVRQKVEDMYELNEALVENYLSLSRKLKERGAPGDLTVSDLLTVPGIIVQKENTELSTAEIDQILGSVAEALDQVLSSRLSEGRNLCMELRSRLGNFEKQVELISEFTLDVENFYRERLLKRLEEFLDREVVDEQRLAQEVLYFVDRSDISEEIARLKSHLARFYQYLDQSEEEPVGKKLDFLCQELNREMNTIMSKSGAVQITEIGVECKAEIERLREQVQNVE